MGAQFFSSLADNALLGATVQLLVEMQAPDQYKPLLKTVFVVSYVLFAAFVGRFADSMEKNKVMLMTNAMKIIGCFLLIFHVHPLLAYAVVGLGAAMYSPAKYGIITEFVESDDLVTANGWMEALTVLSIILGAVLSGILIKPNINEHLNFLNVLGLSTEQDIAIKAIILVLFIYGIAALLNLKVPKTGAKYPKQSANPVLLVKSFFECFLLLWKDKLGQISLFVTTLFWGASATLQFVVLDWARLHLGLNLAKSLMLQGVLAIGVITGSIISAKFIKLNDTLKILFMGVLLGLSVMLMVTVYNIYVAYILLIVVGACGGFLLVPMNALLQHRGHSLMSAGQSISVQNFNENLNILLMTGSYSLMIQYFGKSGLTIAALDTITLIFGGLVAGLMFLVISYTKVLKKKQVL
jgi:MFS family permease